MSKVINIPGKLHSIALGNILASAIEIYDDKKKKNQQVINSELAATLQEAQNDISDLQSESGLVQQLAAALEAAGEEDLATVIVQTADLNTKIEQVNRSISAINSQLNGMTLTVLNEDEYETLSNSDDGPDENTLYFVTEVEEE